MVKIELGKKDSVWVALVIFLVGIGFVFAYGGNTPAVMGHSAEELEGVAMEAYVNNEVNNLRTQLNTQINALQTQIDGLGGPGSTLDLVNGFHSSAQCASAGGVVVSVSEGKICRFNGASCASGGWLKYKSYSTTVAASYSFSPSSPCSRNQAAGCTTGFHAFGNIATETCQAWKAVCSYNGDDPYACGSSSCVSFTLSATINQVGCY